MVTIIINIAFICALAWIIAKACDAFEVATDYLGRNMSDGVKGGSLNAIGSSMPEFMTTVFFLLFASQSELGYNLAASIGGDTGSAIFNSIIIPIMILGVITFGLKLKGAEVSKKVILRDGLFLVGAEVLLLVLLSSSTITHWHGWVFTGFYVIYLAYMILSMKKSDAEDDTEEEEEEEEGYNRYEMFLFRSPSGKTGRAWIILLGAVLVLSAACAGLVHAAEELSVAFGWNMLFVSLIFIAAASSVPDTIISMRDAKKGNHEDALSNVLGSNIFDITISMGLPVAIYLLVTGQSIDFAVAGEKLIDIRVMLLAVTILTIGIFYFSKTLGKTTMVLLFILYAVFVAYAFGAATYHSGGSGFLAETAGTMIEWLHAHLSDPLRAIADGITGNW